MTEVEARRQRCREWHRKKYHADPTWAERRNARSREWVKQQRARGLCTKCPQPATHRTVCEEHFWKARKSNWRKRGVLLTLESFHSRLAMQGFQCPLCRTELSTVDAVVDHCHRTGRIRGLLCISCNSAIGKLGDTPSALRRAVAYLEAA